VARARFGRRTVALTAASLLALQLFSGAGIAAVPSATASADALAPGYSGTNASGYRATFDYTDASTLAKLFLHVNTTGAESRTFLSITKNGAAVSNACEPGLPLDCSFRQVRQGDHFVVTLGLAPLASATAVSAEFIWSSNGATDSDGGTSHGDTWVDPDGPATTPKSTDPNFGGGFFGTGGGTVQNANVGPGNSQSTKLANLPAAVAATVLDGPNVTFACITTSTVNCATQFGEWSEIHVGDGQVFTTAFQALISYAGNANPKGYIHALDGGGQEAVGLCPKKNPAASAPCFTWNNQSNTATLYLLQNGGIKGFN
jgi:hypothetical protein